MEKVTFDYSTKIIPTTSKKHYLKCLMGKTELLIKNMRWRAFFYLNPQHNKDSKETYGFKSSKTPPAIKEMNTFENQMIKMIQSVQFTEHMNIFQQKLKKDIKVATSSNELIVKADKTANFYKMKPNEYQSLLEKNIQKS